MEASEFSQEEESQDQGEIEEIDEQPAGSEDEEDVEPEGGGATDTEGTPETSGESA